MTLEKNGRPTGDDQPDPRAVLAPVAAALQAAGFYAYVTVDEQSRWSVACDTDEGHIDVRIGDDGFELDVWDTSPGMFVDDEDERRQAARERLARVMLPRVARGFLEPNQEAWWDEVDRGVGLRVSFQLPFALQDQIGQIARQRLAQLNDLIAFVESKLID